MSYVERIDEMDKVEFRKAVAQCTTKKELHELLNVPINGTGTRAINRKLNRAGGRFKPKKPKWKKIKKICPVCGKEFETLKGHPKEKITCGYSCSNVHFRSGKDNPNWKEEVYRTTCFEHHKKKCICCDEELIVAVHHYDGNKKNNSPENLMPMCPTHHQYWHSNYRHMIQEKVDEYREEFIRSVG